jgi:amino acid adenylation domain-containing protein
MNLEKDNIEDAFPMSDVSKGMIYHTLKESSSYMFHEQSVHFLETGRFDAAVFEKALSLLAEKHENLRSVFNMFDYAEPFQIVLKKIEPDIDYIDISGRGREDQEIFLRRWLERDRNDPFDLRSMRLLWRARVIFLGPGHICFAWITHHAIMDGWSTASLVTEIHNTYVELLKDPFFLPARLKCRYRDFVAEQLFEKKNEANHAFWKRELTNYKRLAMPFRDPAPQELFHSGFLYKDYDLGLGLLESLRKLAAERNYTVKNLCFAAYLYTSYFFSNQQDLLVGLLCNTRPSKEDGDKVIGCFLNTLPFRYKMRRDLSWAEFVADVDERMTDYLRYGVLPFTEIVKIAGERENAQNPLFDILFNYTDFHVFDDLLAMDGVGSAGNTAAPLADGIQKDNMLITFLLTVRNRFSCKLLHYDAVIKAAEVDRLMEVYRLVLQKIARCGEERADKSSLFTPEERELTQVWVRRGYPLERLLDELVSAQAGLYPQRPAIVDRGSVVSYQELEESSDRLALRLQEAGVGRGDLVGILLERSAAVIVSMLAVLKTGAAYLPLSVSLPEQRIRYMLEDSRCRLVIGAAPYRRLLPPGPGWIDIDGVSMAGARFDPDPSRTSNDLAYVIYTSGSTGLPKGVMVTHRNVINLVYALQEEIYGRYDGPLQLALLSPFDFDASVQQVYGALLLGHTVHIVPEEHRADGEELVKFFRSQQTVISDGTPTHLRLILDSGEALPETMKHFLIAGEVLPKRLAERFYERYASGIAVSNLYGPTETCVDSTVFHLQPGLLKVYPTIPIGRPLPNERVFLLSEDGQRQGIGVTGELCIAGEGVSRGYLHKPVLTGEKFVPDPAGGDGIVYRTGDLARWLPDGNIEFIGRRDDQVKLRGFRIELNEIRKALLDHKEIEDAIVKLLDDEGGDYLCAYIVTPEPIDTVALRDLLKKTLPSYMLPGHFIQLTEWPRTVSGKIDLQALPAPASDPQGEGMDMPGGSGAVTELQAGLLDIWREVLKKERIGMEEDFFSLGGDSIKLIKLLHAIKMRLDVKLNVQHFYRNATVEKLSRLITADRDANQTVPEEENANELATFRENFINNL